MPGSLFDKEEKYAKKLLKECPFLKKMWQEREKAFDEAHRKEALIEKKYSRIAKKSGLKSVKFAYNECCFGIDVNDVDMYGENIKENRMLIHDLTLKETS